MTATPTFRIVDIVKGGLFARTVRVEVVTPGVRRNVVFNGAFPDPNWTDIEDRWLSEEDIFEGRIEGEIRARRYRADVSPLGAHGKRRPNDQRSVRIGRSASRKLKRDTRASSFYIVAHAFRRWHRT